MEKRKRKRFELIFKGHLKKDKKDELVFVFDYTKAEIRERLNKW